MDFIISYYLYNKIVKKEKIQDYELQEEKKSLLPIIKCCSFCGQNIYFCQCKKDITKRIFNPEKDIY